MKAIESWNMGILPPEFDTQDPESISNFQYYMDISAVLQACTFQVSDTECTSRDGSGLLRILLKEKVSPILLRQFYRLAGKSYSYIEDPNEREIDFISTVMDLLTEDLLVHIELRFDDGTYQLRTFMDLEPDMDISCLYLGDDMSLVDLRTINEGLGSVDQELQSSFIAVRYQTRHTQSGDTRLPTGVVGSTDPVTAFPYIESYANWFEKL